MPSGRASIIGLLELIYDRDMERKVTKNMIVNIVTKEAICLNIHFLNAPLMDFPSCLSV